MNELALFAGAGGGILGGKLLGWRTVCAVEWDQYAATVLAQRQNDGLLESFPIWDDVQTFDGRPWRGIVDVISGGFPCQDISVAGKGAGIDGERSGMWRHMARIIGDVRPSFVFVENSPMLVHRGLARVLADLSKMGYDSRWCIMGADDAGAPHRRKRIWILAYTGLPKPSGRNQAPQRQQLGNRRTSWGKLASCSNVADAEGWTSRVTSKRERRENSTRGSANLSWHPKPGAKMDDTNSAQRKGAGFTSRSHQGNANANTSGAWWGQDPAEIPESGMGRMADGVAHRVDRLKAIGNGQVPSVAALAWRILSETV